MQGIICNFHNQNGLYDCGITEAPWHTFLFCHERRSYTYLTEGAFSNDLEFQRHMAYAVQMEVLLLSASAWIQNNGQILEQKHNINSLNPQRNCSSQTTSHR